MIRKELMSMYLDKYNVQYDKNRDIYSKSFFIANSDSYRLVCIEKTYGYGESEFIVDGKITDTVSDGDTIEISLEKHHYEKCTFLIRNITKKTETTMEVIEDEFEGLDETELYKDASILIALYLNREGLHNVRVYYRFTFIESDCRLYLEGCVASGDEEKALEHIDNPEYFYESSKEYRENDILLLYSPQELNLLLDNKERFEQILDKHSLEIKGLFYSKCDIELDCYHEPDEHCVIYSTTIPTNSLCIDVAKVSKPNDRFEYIDDSSERAMCAVKDISKEFDILPAYYSGFDSMPNGEDRTFLKEGEDFMFIKGFDKAALLLPDMHKYPKRYLGNYQKCVEMFDTCCDIHLTYEMYSYKVNKDLVHVYLYDYDKYTNTKKVTRYDVNPNIYSREHIDFIIDRMNAYDEDLFENVTYDTLLNKCQEARSCISFGETISCYVAMFKKLQLSNEYFVEYDEGYEPYEEYEARIDIRDFIDKNTQVQTIADEVISESEKSVYTGPTWERIRYIKNEIACLENRI